MRRVNNRSTFIYWLIDIRPETIVAGWSNGRPFYCGKTVLDPKYRLANHFSDARKYSERLTSIRLIECGEHVRIVTMEVVSADADWVAREKFWIKALRQLSPDCTNVTAGGQGMTGHVPSAETRAKRSASLKGRIFTPEHRAKIGIASANRSPDVYAKIAASNKCRVVTEITRARLSAAGFGKRKSDATKARMKEAAKHRTPDRYVKSGAKLKGRKFKPETLARMSEGQRRRYEK